MVEAMRAAVLKQVGEVVLEDRPVPRPGRWLLGCSARLLGRSGLLLRGPRLLLLCAGFLFFHFAHASSSFSKGRLQVPRSPMLQEPTTFITTVATRSTDNFGKSRPREQVKCGPTSPGSRVWVRKALGAHVDQVPGFGMNLHRLTQS